MSSVAAPQTIALPRVRRLADSEALAVGVLVLWSVFLLALMWGRWGDLTMDTGYDFLAASRTAHGDLPYIDYNYFYGPIAPLLLGAIYAVTGAAVWPAVLLGLVLAAAAIALTYALAREFVAPLAAVPAAALVAAAAMSSANNSYVLPHSTSGPLATVFVLGALLCLVRFSRREAPTRGLLIGGGVLIGLTLLTRLEAGLPLLIAAAAWFGLRAWRAGDGRRAALRDGAIALAPALALPLVGYGAFLTSVPLHDLLWANLYPRDFVKAGGHVVLDAHAPKTVGSVAKLVGRLVIYAGGAAALVVAASAIQAGGRRRRVALALVVGAVLAFLAVLVARPETVRFYLAYGYGWIPAGAWVAVAALAWFGRSSAQRRAALDAPLLVALTLALAISNTYASFNPFPNALHPEATPYVLPLAAVFLAWLHVGLPGESRPALRTLGVAWLAVLAVASAGLVLHDASAETTTVRAAHGSMTARPADGPALQQLVDAIERHTRPGDQILLAPQMTALYVMTDRRNPLPQLSLLPGALPDAAAEARAIDRLRDVRLVAIDRAPLSVYGQGAFGTTFDRRLAVYVGRNYRHLATVSSVGPAARHIDIFTKDLP